MTDLKLLAAYGSSDERLKEIFTAVPLPDGDEFTDEQRKLRKKDCDRRKEFEECFRDMQNEGLMFSLSNHKIWSAVDLAWDSRPIHPHTYSLMLYAEGRIDLGSCVKQLTDMKCADEFVVKDPADNKIIGINMPRFTDCVVNLVPSFITRRLAAQSNKFNSLYPCYKFEPRGTSPSAKLRADVMSQVADIMADAYGHRHQFVQSARDMMLYSTSFNFVKKGWERDVQWRTLPMPEEFELPPGQKPQVEKVIIKEGISLVNPHPCRVFYDLAHPPSSINTDTGCEYIGYWDVVRARDVVKNKDYWNTDNVAYNSEVATLFSNYSQFFSQYYCTIKAPNVDYAGSNDVKSSVGYMSSNQMDAAVVICVNHKKLTPIEHGIGDYPYPVWVRFITAGSDGTVIHAEFLPSTPGIVYQFNCKDDRRLNKSIAHELLSYQDQLTNLQNYLLLCLSTDNFKVFVLDIDTLNTPEKIQEARRKFAGKNYYNDPMVLEVSRSKLAELNIDVTKVVHMVETRNSAAIDIIFRAMLQLLSMVEKLMALSPQEQGQPSPRETSATEVNLIATTTESVYGFLSDSLDEGRAALKKLIYESFIVCGNNDLRVPAINRYSSKVIQAAGFDVVPEEMEMPNNPDAVQRHTIIGSKMKLQYDYIFTSRDGAERAVNTQAANVLVQLLGVLQDPEVRNAMGKEKYFEVINELVRLSGAGIDLNLEPKEGESDEFGPDQMQQIQQVLAQITGQLEKQQQGMEQQSQAIQQIGQAGMELEKSMKQDMKDFKTAIATTITNLSHKNEMEKQKFTQQLGQLMRDVVRLHSEEEKAMKRAA